MVRYRNEFDEDRDFYTRERDQRMRREAPWDYDDSAAERNRREFLEGNRRTEFMADLASVLNTTTTNHDTAIIVVTLETNGSANLHGTVGGATNHAVRHNTLASDPVCGAAT